MVKRLSYYFAVLMAGALLAPALAQAATGLTIQPVKVSQTINKGQEVRGTILLKNASEEDVVVETNIEDFVPTAGEESISFVGRAPGVTTVRDWITILGPKSFEFKKGEQREIEYVIKAPEDAEPGSHFGVLFFKAIKLSEVTSQIKVGTQVGVLVFVTIPGNYLQRGEIQNFSAPQFVQGGPVNFTMKFENTGTVHFEPKGTIKITNMFGKEVGSVPIEGQVVLPTGAKNLSFAWIVKGLLLGKYKATAEVVDGQGRQLTSQTVSFYAVPVWYALSFIGAFLLIFLVLKFIKKRIKFSVQLK